MLTYFSQPSIDVEAAIRNNAVDVGIFGPKSLLSEADAGRMAESLREEMLNILDRLRNG